MRTLSKNILAKLTAICALVLLLSGTLFLNTASAAAAQIYLTPATSSLQNGNTVSLDFRINPGVAVNSVEGTLHYDTSKLQYVSTDTSSSAFSTSLALAANTTAGTVNIQRGTDFTNGVTVGSDARIAVVSFKALAGSGSTSVTLTGADAYDTNGNIVTATLGSATLNLTTPAVVTPPPTTTGGGTTTTTPPAKTTTPSTTTTPKTTTPSTTAPGSKTTPTANSPSAANTGTPPVISDKTIQYTQAIITSTSATPTQVYIRYGTDSSMTEQTPLSDFTTAHQVSLPTTLIPGQTYYYVVVSKDQSGAVSQTAVENFTTKGLTISVGIYDKNHKPIKNKTVTLHSATYTVKTNDQGIATFTNVAPGTHHVTYAPGGKSYDQGITVENNVQTVGSVQTAATQKIAVVYGLAQTAAWYSSTLFITLLLLVIVVAIVLYYLQSHKLHLAFPEGKPLTSQPIVVGGTHTDTPPPSVSAVTPAQTPVQPDRLSNIQGVKQQAPGEVVQPKEASPVEPIDKGKAF